jgi:hypothetical protein
VANNRLDDVFLTGLRSTTYVEKMSDIAAVMGKKMHFISIEGVGIFREKHSLHNVLLLSVLLHDILANSFSL